MKAVNLYILTRNTNPQLYGEYENILAGRAECRKVRQEEFQCLNALVGELMENGLSVRNLDGFYYSFTIEQIGKEFDLLKIAHHETVLNLELKSRLIPEKDIEKQLVKNKHYLNYLAPEVKLFTYIQETNAFYKLEAGRLRKSTVKEVIHAIKKMKSFEEREISRLFRVRDFLISPLNTPDKFLNGQYFLTQQQEEIKKEIIKDIEKNGTFRLWGITGSAGTGKTLLLYDLAKALRQYGKCCIVHSGMLCNGHRYLNDEFDHVHVYEPKSAVYDLLIRYDFIFVDEAQRIYNKNLNIILEAAKDKGMPCVFSYDYFQVLSHKEQRRNIPEKLRSVPGFQERKLTDKIRSNKEIASFIRNLIDLNDKSRIPYKYEDIEVVYANNEEEADDIITYYSKERNYKFIGYTQSRYYKNSIDHFPGEINTHEAVGQEFDNVMIMMDGNFRYHDNGRLQGKKHPNPDYIFYKLLYQGVSRPREKLCILVIGNMPLFEKILSIKSGCGRFSGENRSE